MSTGYNLEAIRADHPVLERWTYMNTGTVGVMPEPVLQTHLANIADHERFGHATQEHAVAGYERARHRLATLLGVPAAEIGFNRNASDGINWVATTFPLSAGDVVLTSTEEHPAMIYPWLAACERAGASLQFFDLHHDPEVLSANIRGAMSSAVKLVALSHVSCETGERIPVDVVRAVVGDGTAILVDASQSVGQFLFAIPDLNADFVIGNGHKWLAGPKGSGFAWFSPNRLGDLSPVYLGDGTVDPTFDRPYYQAIPSPALAYAPTASRFEYGTRAWHTYGALADAIDYLENLGWENIFNHVASVTSVAKAQLGELPGVNLITPEAWSNSSGLLSFTIAGLSGIDASQMLWKDHAIIQRRVQVPSAVRVSVACFNSTEDVERLIDAVAQVSREAGN